MKKPQISGQSIPHPACWQGWKQGELQVHFIHTGVAESIFFILPDATTMLVDCGDHPAVTRLEYAVPVVPGPERLAGDWIARYIRRVLPDRTPFSDGRPLIDYMVLTHFHADHSGSIIWQTKKREDAALPGCYRSGFALAAERLSFRYAFDRGAPDYEEPHGYPYPAQELDHMQRLYAALKQRDHLQVCRFEPGWDHQLRLLHDPDPYHDFQITNLAANGKILCRNGSIRDLYENDHDPAITCHENGLSLVFLLRYGKFSLFSGGDFSDSVLDGNGIRHQTETLLAAELDRVDVAKITHHGHHSMPEALVKALGARVWVAPVWDQLHVTDDVMTRLTDPGVYPGPRTIYPTVFPRERCRSAQEQAFYRDIVPEVCGSGAHVVVTVPPGGETYTVTCLSAADEEMRILGQRKYLSQEN